MKSQIVKQWMTAVLMLLITGVSANAQITTDPILTAAVAANTTAISKEITAAVSVQSATLAQNVALNAYMNSILEYEKKMYNYLSKAQGVITSAVGIARCLKLSADIVSELGECSRAAVDHPMGALVTGMVSDNYTDILQESVALVGYIAPIVQGGGDNNLLNTAERVRVLNNVTTLLYNLQRKVKSLKYRIQYMRWTDLIREISPDVYYQFLNTQAAYDATVREIEILKRYY